MNDQPFPDSTNNNRQRKQEYLRSFLRHPGEAPNVDYKSAEIFDGKSEFSLKLIRHILGMANSGGGLLIIGFPEGLDGKPQPDPNIADDVLASYDSTSLPQMVAKKILGTDKPEIIVHHVDFEGSRYPILEIDEFATRPFFCRSDHFDSQGKTILRSGALYIRTSSSNTEEVSNPEEWDRLMKVAMRKRNDEFLGRVSTLLEDIREGTTIEEESANAPQMLPNWFTEQRQIAEERIENQGLEKKYFEVMSYIPYGSGTWSQRQLLEAMTNAELSKTGWPQGIVMPQDQYKPKPIRNGIHATIPLPSDLPVFNHWGLSTQGAYYFTQSYYEDFKEERKVPSYDFDEGIRRFAEAIDHTCSLYSELEVDPMEQIYLEINHRGLRGRHLMVAMRSLFYTTVRDRISEEDTTNWKIVATLDELKVNRNSYVYEAITSLTIFFDFFKPKRSLVDSIIDVYDGKRRSR